uniref:Uncharacterized protein n=1 Tax=Lepeophtheirus salmonis TaxID=72036 RepID=A0A0K2UJX7_LEPSM
MLRVRMEFFCKAREGNKRVRLSKLWN